MRCLGRSEERWTLDAGEAPESRVSEDEGLLVKEYGKLKIKYLEISAELTTIGDARRYFECFNLRGVVQPSLDHPYLGRMTGPKF